MGQAKIRALRAASAPIGQPVALELGDRTNRRLAAALFGAQGARLVARAADQQAQALEAAYREAVAGVLEVRGIELRGDEEIDHDQDHARLVVRTKGAAAEEPPPAAEPTQASD